jgi:hypothetical protein
MTSMLTAGGMSLLLLSAAQLAPAPPAGATASGGEPQGAEPRGALVVTVPPPVVNDSQATR